MGVLKAVVLTLVVCTFLLGTVAWCHMVLLEEAPVERKAKHPLPAPYDEDAPIERNKMEGDR